MGTRSLTYIYDENEPQAMLCFYRQFDGYPEGHGMDLAKFLAGIELINGISGPVTMGKQANGPGCLAAQILTRFKNEFGVGGIYIRPVHEKQDAGQEFEYRVCIGYTSGITIECRSTYGQRVIWFAGTPAEFLEHLEKKAAEPADD